MRVLTALEALCLAVLVAGVWIAYNPGWALIVGGTLGMIACEWTATALRASRRAAQ